MNDIRVTEPVPVFLLGTRHLVFSIDAITHLRRQHHICGVLVGNIPQATQQTLFSGVPLELMPEEARILVEKGVAYVVDDIAAHEKHVQLSDDAKAAYWEELRTQGLEAARAFKQQSVERKKAYYARAGIADADASGGDDLEPMGVTPTTSYPLLEAAASDPTTVVTGSPEVSSPSSYAVFKRLHEEGYFLSPGLRFGCQYVAYPGDPLRYHSHFLVTGHEWDEEISLLEIVGGGRLGTGVKKGYMIGGAEPDEDGEGLKQARTFSIEWAAM